jgi:hypothetical protein
MLIVGPAMLADRFSKVFCNASGNVSVNNVRPLSKPPIAASMKYLGLSKCGFLVIIKKQSR